MDEEITCGDCGGMQIFAVQEDTRTVSGNYNTALQVTRYRLAMEMASSLLFRGKYDDAYAVLKDAMKPVRKTKRAQTRSVA